jgi:DNA-binding response OmpR family regulator
MAKVLLIDDNSDIQRFVRHHVEHAGHEFLGVTSAEEGRTCAFDRSPDVILLDWMLPRRDGIELCRELKRDLRTCRVPVILLTVRSSPTDKIQAFEAGANEYLTKPFHPGELLARIESAVRLQALQNKLTNVETARRTLGALSHHILNAVQVITTAAEDFTPGDERGRGFQETVLRQAQRVNHVLDSLAEVIAHGKLQVADYPGVRGGILDIPDRTPSRLSRP